MTDKQRYDSERWKLLIAEAASRDIKLKDWLALRGISKDAYYYWLRKLQKKILIVHFVNYRQRSSRNRPWLKYLDRKRVVR